MLFHPPSPRRLILCLLLSTLSLPLRAGGIYQKPADFIAGAFDNRPPGASVVWPDRELKRQMAAILQHPYRGLRVRYWQRDGRTAWILDETGKEKPITTGIVIDDGKITRIKVLAFRESRGWEVRHDFFTDQFKQAGLTTTHELDRPIDNISGATLSVRAVTRLARIALLLDQSVRRNTKKPPDESGLATDQPLPPPSP